MDSDTTELTNITPRLQFSQTHQHFSPFPPLPTIPLNRKPTHVNNNKQKKKQQPFQQNKPTIAKESELRELISCKARVQSEFKLFAKLNPGAFQKQLQLRHEPKLVKLDSEFASGAKIKTQNNTKTRSTADLYTKENREQFSQNTSLDNMPIDHLRQFSSLPISTRTKRALVDNGFKQCTRVQHASLPSSLALQDLFVLSCTGSGKTLAFIIPVLETLWQQRWSRNQGLGALIISPTRELALQTFHVLRRIGVYHDFSAGLLIGGTSFDEERRAIADMNILVCTPGRLIHHLEKSSGLDLSSIVSLVIDECDHLLDIGFAEQFEIIAPLLPSKEKLAKTISNVENKQIKKQLQQGHIGFHSMLFSATMSSVVRSFAKRILSPDLRLISLTGASGNNPENLSHRFLVVPETEKLRTLFEFLRLHRSNKTVIFVSTARQASFLYELFRGLSIKASVHRLHSKLGHQSRTQEYYQFQHEQYGVLICTDVAARGLDLTGVSWVVHYDCPTSIIQYTHRSGRTARLKGNGTNLLMLTPHQLRFAHLLHLNNPGLKLQQVGLPQFRSEFYAKMSQFYSEHPLVKNHAEKAIMSYMQHLIHERTDTGDLLKQLLQDKSQRAKLFGFISLDIVENSKTGAWWVKKLKTLSPVETTAFMCHLFNITHYDIIGLCRGYGLQSIPVVISAGDQEAFEEEHGAEFGEKKVQQQQDAKKSTKSDKKSNEIDDDGTDDQELAVLTRVNVELDEFIKRTRLIEATQAKAQKNNNTQQQNTQTTDIFTKSKIQPKPVNTIGNRSIDINQDDIICDVFTTWSDDELDEDERQEQINNYSQNENIFEQLKLRYKNIDTGDKQYVKDLAIKRRRFKQNVQKLEQLRKLGYNLTIEQLEDMLQQKKSGHDIDMDAYRGDNEMGDDSDEYDDGEEIDDILDGLGQSDDENDNSYTIGGGGGGGGDDDSENDDFDGQSFGIGGGDDDDDSDSDSGNEFHKMVKKEAQENAKKSTTQSQSQQQQQQRSLPRNLLNESSDEESDSDVPQHSTKKIAPTPIQQPKLVKKIVPVVPSTTPAQTAKNTKSQSTAALMGMDSDDDEEEEKPTRVTAATTTTQTKPSNAKQAFNLDETSDSEEEDQKPAVQKPAPKVRLTKEEKLAERRLKNQAAKETRLAREQREFEAKRINLNEDSDDSSDDDDTHKKPAPTKKFLNLDETSSDDDSDSDEEPVSTVNKNGKRAAPTQLAPKSKTAPKPPQPDTSVPVTTRATRSMRKL